MNSSKLFVSLISLISSCHSAAAFARSASTAATASHHVLHAINNDEVNDVNRRYALKKFSLAFVSSVAAVSLTPQTALAESDLFKANPLTNRFLEEIRIREQDEKDNIYGGELESGSAKPDGLDQYVELLQPILTVEKDLSTVNQLINSNSDNANNKPVTKEEYTALFEKVTAILSKSQFDKINFKKAFNAFADNIYYSDPDRANLYLGGGAVPKTSQSIAYLLRNDILTGIEDMRAEVQYLLKELAKLSPGEMVKVDREKGLDLEEILGLSKTASEGMIKYLDLVPPKELELAKAKFAL